MLVTALFLHREEAFARALPKASGHTHQCQEAIPRLGYLEVVVVAWWWGCSLWVLTMVWVRHQSLHSQLNGVVGFLVPWILAFVSYCDTILYSDRHIAIQNHQQVLATEVQWPPSVTNTWNDRVYIASRRNEVLTSLGLELFFDQWAWKALWWTKQIECDDCDPQGYLSFVWAMVGSLWKKRK